MKDPINLPTPGKEQAAVPTDQTLIQAARSLSEINRPFNPTGTEAASLEALTQSLQCEGVGEAHLQVHVRTLDALYNRLLMKALENTHWRDRKPTDNCIDVDYAQLALRAQKQCRQTVQALRKKQENELSSDKKDT